MPKHRIGVIGAGVIGLSSALQIIENVPDVEVTVMGDQFSPNTTGDSSAGFWEPFIVDGTRVREWSKTTFNYLTKLARSELAGKLGAQFCSGYQLGVSDVDWKDIVLGFRKMTPQEIALFPGTKSKDGCFFTTLMIECSLYLPWLMLKKKNGVTNRDSHSHPGTVPNAVFAAGDDLLIVTSGFKEKGGKVQHRTVKSLHELSNEFDLVVNCCGLRARSFVNDQSVTPVRGQVIKVSAPWIKHFAFDITEGGTAYILPGTKAVTVGGTTIEGDWNENVDQKDKSEMWERCVNLFPQLKGAKYLFDWVGLRPYRTEVRMELEEIPHMGKVLMVVHNYGHGGSGVTLHWGCAQEATRLVEQGLKRLAKRSPAKSSKL